MLTDNEYNELLSKIPEPIVKKLIVPLSSADPGAHLKLMAFLFVIYDKGYCIKKENKP